MFLLCSFYTPSIPFLYPSIPRWDGWVCIPTRGGRRPFPPSRPTQETERKGKGKDGGGRRERSTRVGGIRIQETEDTLAGTRHNHTFQHVHETSTMLETNTNASTMLETNTNATTMLETNTNATTMLSHLRVDAADGGLTADEDRTWNCATTQHRRRW
eukprot:scaffold56_cov390-Pavlova_lutheri.AAC.9